MAFAFWFIIMAIGGAAVAAFVIWFVQGDRGGEYTPWDDEEVVARKEPYFRREVVEAKVRSLFPSHDPSEILRLLDGVQPSLGSLEQMQLDILKLSDGDVARLRHYIEVSGSLWGALEVVSKAEYPRSSRIDSSSPTPKWVVEKDVRQYLKWLKRR